MLYAKIKKRILFGFFWAVLIISFLFSAFLILLKANGYQLNYKNWQILQTGMVILGGEPSTAEVTVNGRKAGPLPARLGNLSPVNYQVNINGDGYSDWQRNIRIEPGKAAVYQNIILFLEEPQDYPVTENLTQDELTQEASRNTQEVKIEGMEIFFQNKLISRFSQNVLFASLYPDENHLIFQTGREIRVMELDGANNTLLFNLNSSEPTKVVYRNNDKSLIYLDNNQIVGKTIR